MPNAQCTIPQWLEQKPEVKVKLIEIFSIPKTGVSEVVTDSMGHAKQTCDGFTHKDLTAITVDKMRDYLGMDITQISETFYTLFDRTLAKIEEDLVVKMIPIVTTVAPVAVEIPKVEALRTIECAVCKKVIKCKDAKFDARIMLMHQRKYHKEIK